LVTNSTPPCTLNCGLQGLCTLSCRAFSYSTTQRHISPYFLSLSSYLSNFSSFTLRASLYLYNPMVHGPWVGLSIWHYITKLGRTTLWLYHTFRAPRPQFVELSNKIGSKLGLWASKHALGGIPCPTSPQHKHHDSPLSHSVGAVIFARSPSIHSWIVQRSAAHWAMACCICCMRYSETSVSGVLLCINVCIPCMCASLPLMSVVMVKSSLIQGWRCALRTASLCHAASTCSCSALACCILASRWVRTIVCVVP